MKRFLLLPLFLLCLIVPAFSQVNFGLKAGANYSDVSFKTSTRSENSGFKTGLHAGVFMVIPAGESFFIRQEFLYSIKGWRYTARNQIEKVHLKYLTQALMAGIQLSPRLYLLLGPEVGYLLDVGPKDYRQGISFSNKLSIDNFKRFDAGITGGISFQVLNRLSLEARYTLGLTPVLDSRTYYFYRQPEGNNRAFQVSLGYTFGKEAVKSTNP